MRHYSACFIALVLFCSVLTTVSEARAEEQLMKLAPEMRLSRGVPYQGEAAENVSATPVQYTDVPQSILDETKSHLLSCTGKIEQLANVKFFQWVSDWTREKGLPPSYIVDFGKVKVEQDLASCETGPICDEDGCLFLGYAAVDSTHWKQDFELHVTYAQFGEIKEADGRKRAEIDVISNKKDCKENGGVESNQGCQRRFHWKNYGLSILPPLTQ